MEALLNADQEDRDGFEIVHSGPKNLDVSTLDVLHLLDHGTTHVRDAAYMHHNVFGILIEADDVDDLLDSELEDRSAMKLAELLLDLIRPPGAWCVKAEDLWSVEELWTGDNHAKQSAGKPDQPLIVRFCSASYIASREWGGPVDEKFPPFQQFHELSFIALSEDAIRKLLIYTGYATKNMYGGLDNYPKVGREFLETIFRRRRDADVQDCLLAAIATRLMVTSSIEPSLAFTTSRSNLEDYNDAMRPMEPRDQDLFLVPRNIYRRHVIGRKEPKEKYIHVFRSFGKKKTSTGRRSSTALPDTPIPELVIGESIPTRKSSYCIFLYELPFTAAAAALESSKFHCRGFSTRRLRFPFLGRASLQKPRQAPVRVADSNLVNTKSMLTTAIANLELLNNMDFTLAGYYDESSSSTSRLLYDRLSQRLHPGVPSKSKHRELRRLRRKYEAIVIDYDLKNTLQSLLDACNRRSAGSNKPAKKDKGKGREAVEGDVLPVSLSEDEEAVSVQSSDLESDDASEDDEDNEVDEESEETGEIDYEREEDLQEYMEHDNKKYKKTGRRHEIPRILKTVPHISPSKWTPKKSIIHRRRTSSSDRSRSRSHSRSSSRSRSRSNDGNNNNSSSSSRTPPQRPQKQNSHKSSIEKSKKTAAAAAAQTKTPSPRSRGLPLTSSSSPLLSKTTPTPSSSSNSSRRLVVPSSSNSESMAKQRRRSGGMEYQTPI